jgi:hypothetical protein
MRKSWHKPKRPAIGTKAKPERPIIGTKDNSVLSPGRSTVPCQSRGAPGDDATFLKEYFPAAFTVSADNRRLWLSGPCSFAGKTHIIIRD